jgi:hypothetical protein
VSVLHLRQGLFISLTETQGAPNPYRMTPPPPQREAVGVVDSDSDSDSGGRWIQTRATAGEDLWWSLWVR